MTLPDAKNAAREIAGADMHVVSYRNVWGFFGSSDRELQAVFITKDNASTERSGIFLDKGEEGRFTEYGLPAGALVMLYDIANCADDEAAALLRLTVLKNYLIRTEKRISAEEFSYMCQELLGI